MPEPHADAVRIVGLLADADRRAVVAALVLGASDVAGIRRATGLDARAIAKAVDRLVRGGLVEVSDGHYLLIEAAFTRAARLAAPAVAEEDHPEASDDEARVLRSFVRDGRLLSMPASHSKRQIVLDHIVQSFEPGVRYTEKQVNADPRRPGTRTRDRAALPGRRRLPVSGVRRVLAHRRDVPDPAGA